jgi:hypothetical protein
MTDDRKQTYGEELNDMFYALQITTKIMESITKEHDKGARDQTDFESRWQGQSELLCRNLAKIKPLVEKFIHGGFSKFSSPVGLPSQEIQTHASAGLNGTNETNATESVHISS